MPKLTRFRAAVIGALSACAVAGVTTAAFGASGGPVADKGVIHFATTYSAGGLTYAAGSAKDKLFGNEAITYAIKTQPTPTGPVKITAKPATIWGKTGTLTGTATGTLTVTNATTGDATITNGKVKATKGTGGWTGHSFTATFSGSGNVKTGAYTVTYKGTYK
jgi:hypothetical protein